MAARQARSVRTAASDASEQEPVKAKGVHVSTWQHNRTFGICENELHATQPKKKVCSSGMENGRVPIYECKYTTTLW